MSACPSPLPKWYPGWETWRLSGGRPANRPKGAPLFIPRWAWACLEERRHQAKPPLVDYGILARSGWFATNHASGPVTEKIVEAKRCDAAYLALVLDGNNEPLDWVQWRTAAAHAGLPVLPWKHCRAPSELGFLLSVASEWGSTGVAPNVEEEAENILAPAVVKELCKPWAGWLAVVTDWRGWVDERGYHGPDWTPLADRATNIIEAFTNTNRPRDIGACVARAKQQGWKSVVPMLSTLNDPQVYGMQAGFAPYRAGYTLDVVDVDDIQAWAA